MEMVTTMEEGALELGSSAGSLTFFVPTDTAFEALGADVVQGAMDDSTFLKKVTFDPTRL